MSRRSVDLITPHPNVPVQRQRKKSILDLTPEQKAIACENVKTNIIYILIMLCVVLIGFLCYTLVIIFEERANVLEEPMAELGGGSFEKMPSEQRCWFENAQRELSDSIHHAENNRKAKNVILFVGDGMGLTTVTASRIYKYGEEGHLSWEAFPHFGLLKTYCADKQVPDSASTATALFCGIKANFETSGVDSSVSLDDCDGALDESNHADSIIKWAQEAQMSTGVVTTTRVVHATPSALYAHVPNRRWECEAKMSADDIGRGCKDIARQLIENEPGKNINVIMGGGRQCLVSSATDSTNDPIDKYSCIATDGRNLIDDWQNDKRDRQLSYAVVKNNEQLNNLNVENTDYVLGIFANGHMKYDDQRDKGPNGSPSLSNMTEQAVRILMKNKNGFLLVVEGGMIDQAHHQGNARRALSEVSALDEAVKRTMELMGDQLDETLIVVTADHSHSLTINGYPKRGSDILGLANKSKVDGVPFTTLTYATGGKKSYQVDVENGKPHRKNPSLDDTTAYDYIQQAGILTDEGAHSGSDVTVYARGPAAHLFQRVHEQSYVAHLIAYAAKIGRFRES